VRKHKHKLIKQFEDFIHTYKLRAKRDYYFDDYDVRCYRMIYAISILFPVDENYVRNEPKVEKCLKDLWFLYFFFKYRIDGYDVKYVNIVKKYS
jgi:hypothetical protein